MAIDYVFGVLKTLHVFSLLHLSNALRVEISHLAVDADRRDCCGKKPSPRLSGLRVSKFRISSVEFCLGGVA